MAPDQGEKCEFVHINDHFSKLPLLLTFLTYIPVSNAEMPSYRGKLNSYAKSYLELY